METNNKTAYFEWLRLFAAAAVVLMHTAAKRWMSSGHTLPQWQVLTWWDSLVRWPVPIFIMITGALFLPRKTPLRKMLGSYIPRMAVSYLIWAVVYGLYFAKPGDGPRELLTAVATGHYHLWYLPFLCGVYLMLPFLQKIAEDERLTNQLLWLSLTIALVIPWTLELAAALFPEWNAAVRALKNHLQFTFFFDHLSLLLLGHVLNRREFTPGQRHLLYGLGTLSLVVVFAGTVWLTHVTNSRSSLFFDHGAPTTLCAAAALFVFARYRLTALPKWASWLADRSFGVYLIHALVIEMLARQGLDALTFAPAWWTPVLALAVFAIAATASALLGKLPLIGRYLA